MGNLTVDEYYHKFMEYLKYCPDDVPSEGKKMQRFELGLSFDIQKHIESDRYSMLEQMYKRAAQIGNISRKEKEKEKANITEKRRKMGCQTTGSQLNFHHKKPKIFGGFQGNNSNFNAGIRGEVRVSKPLLDRDGKERKYF